MPGVPQVAGGARAALRAGVAGGGGRREGIPSGGARGVRACGGDPALPLAQARERAEVPARELQAAWQQPTYEQAKAALKRTRSELALMNQSAAKSLDEGLEETLTLHRLGLAEELRLSFATTNVIESVQAHVGRLTDHVDHYRNSEQKQRWVATALLEIEPRLRRVRGMKHLPTLRAAIQREMGITKRQAAA
ncbi:MAG: hypothetical protein E6K81_11405 [Candidatus Eisenbacteria bacterium]|uniref:Uncharacterized protein n=1 Tax=Eiseniibacteriota bacterium TaxID=2212470 RepID=A0A538U4U6_UNCEI|nr:MAG: hypothetical protein E6K81_11405 [Candidatus Eisenbacteria bacterium]